MTDAIESPCTGVCRLDRNSICTGCFRTMSEIMLWPDADRKTRQEILCAAAERKAEQRNEA